MRGGQPAFQPAMVALPAEPSAEEKARHELTRYPSAPWCIHCIVGKGKELPHRRILADAVAPLDQHMFFASYCFIETNAGVTDADEQFATTLVVVDKDTGAVAAMSLPSKEASPILHGVCRELHRLLRPDQGHFEDRWRSRYDQLGREGQG